MPATIESRRQHLARADRVRLRRAEAFGELKTLPRREAAAQVADMLDVMPYWLRSMGATDLLRRSGGRRKADWRQAERWLRFAGAYDMALRVERLSLRQRRVLRQCLRAWAAGDPKGGVR